MKRILRSVLVLLLSVVMCLSWINFWPVKGDSNIDMLIYVDEAIYGDVDVKQAIDTYAADIQSEGWTNLTIFTDAAALAPEDVRYIITLCWMWYHITGCLLIGDFPSAMWENGTSLISKRGTNSQTLSCSDHFM